MLINPKTIKTVVDLHEEVSDFVESRWREMAGFGCGYFTGFEIRGDLVIIKRDQPSRLGGGSGYNHEIPLACFDPNLSLADAKKIFDEYPQDSKINK